MGSVDRRGVLAGEIFAYTARKNGQVAISWQGRPVTTLAGKAAKRFLSQVAGADAQGRQLIMAKATGNFKRGNEKLFKKQKP